jgi:ribosomal 50S subunit-recycling heat shock protein
MIVQVKANGATQNAVITTPPTVASFKSSHGPAYGVNANTKVRVNGTEAADSYVLQHNDVVEFYQATSQKAAVYTISVRANGQTQAFSLDSAKTASQLLADADYRTALGLGANTVVKVNGGSKSNEATLSAGDVVEFSQATSQKAA